MEDFNKTETGQNPTGDQNKPKSQATGSASNKKTAPEKTSTKRTGSLASKTSSRKVSVPSSGSKRASGGGSDVPHGVKSVHTSADQSPTVAKGTIAEPDTKIMVSEVSEEVVPIERELKKQSHVTSHQVQPKEERDDYIKSVITQAKPGEGNAERTSGEETMPQKSTKGNASARKLRKLEKKSLKAERKVDKLMDKYKTAQKEDVKRGKLQNIKDKLLTAYAKLRKRHRKLRAAEK